MCPVQKIAPKDYPEPLREMISLHEILRKLGIPAADIFISPRDLPDVIVTIKQDGKQIGWRLGKWQGSREEFLDQWQAVVADWNEFCNDEERGWPEVYEQSRIRRCAVTEVLANLVIHGFRIGPAALN